MLSRPFGARRNVTPAPSAIRRSLRKSREALGGGVGVRKKSHGLAATSEPEGSHSWLQTAALPWLIRTIVTQNPKSTAAKPRLIASSRFAGDRPSAEPVVAVADDLVG